MSSIFLEYAELGREQGSRGRGERDSRDSSTRSKSLSYSFDQMLLSISSHSQIKAAPPDVLNQIVATLEY